MKSMEAGAGAGHRVVDAPEQERIEIRDGDDVVGFVRYHRRPGLIALVHTEIDETREAEGFGGELVAAALDRARAEGLAVLPFCPFVGGWIQRHPEYTDLVPEQFREHFGL